MSNVCVFIVDPKTRTYINRGGSFPGDGPPLTTHRGHFQIRGLTPGRYLVDFVSSCAGGKFADRWYRNGPTPGQRQAGHGSPRADHDRDQPGDGPGRQHFRRYHRPDRPAREEHLRAGFDRASLGYGFATTSKTGHYTVNGLDTGQYSVYAAPCTVHGPNLGG